MAARKTPAKKSAKKKATSAKKKAKASAKKPAKKKAKASAKKPAVKKAEASAKSTRKQAREKQPPAETAGSGSAEPEEGPVAEQRGEQDGGAAIRAAMVNLGHILKLRPRVATSFPQQALRDAKLALEDEVYASVEKAARAVGEKALELTHKGNRPKRGRSSTF